MTLLRAVVQCSGKTPGSHVDVLCLLNIVADKPIHRKNTPWWHPWVGTFYPILSRCVSAMKDIGLQVCLGWWFVSSGISMNATISGFPSRTLYCSETLNIIHSSPYPRLLVSEGGCFTYSAGGSADCHRVFTSSTEITGQGYTRYTLVAATKYCYVI